MAEAFDVPVALFIFRRPDLTARLLEKVAEVRPRTLLVVADGPRANRPDDAELCEKTRHVMQRIDWPCEVRTHFSDVNLGCKRRMSSGIDWVFAQYEEAILLEDDCLPSSSFFPFCSEMLRRYRNDERVMTVGGTNYQSGIRRTPDSYYFSAFAHIWGWATWRRAWQHYDVQLGEWPGIRDRGALLDILGAVEDVAYWTPIFNQVHEGALDTWDYQWIFTSFVQNGLTVVPEKNLITNVGFGAEATHTVNADDRNAEIPNAELDFPLRHPSIVAPHRSADLFEYTAHFGRRLSPMGRWVRSFNRRLAELRAVRELGAD